MEEPRSLASTTETLTGKLRGHSRNGIVVNQVTNRFVIVEDNILRKIWDVFVALLLSYTALVFPYRLCFIDYRQPPGSVEKAKTWDVIETAVDFMFFVDFLAYFFFTYRDRGGNEITNWCSIVCNYLRTYFVINLVACVPPFLWEELFRLFSAPVCSGNGCPTKTVRLLRLQRASRLLRLLRLFRMAKLWSFIENISFWRWLQDHIRGVRLFNFLALLFLIVHCLACGWYLIVSFEVDANSSWLARRVVGPSEETLLSRPEPEQWLHAFYFILTVFTTVGFGDMSALTMIEIGYVVIVMLVGAIVHSIVVSQMISIVTSVDECEKAAMTKNALINAYAQRSGLDKSVLRRLQYGFGTPRKGEVDFDREAMTKLFSSVAFPRDLLDELPTSIHHGKLLSNMFCRLYHLGTQHVQPRFTILLSLLLERRSFLAGETVYRTHDHPCNVFLVVSGVFASVGIATPNGGIDENVQKDCDGHLLKSQPIKAGIFKPIISASSNHPAPDAAAKSAPYKLYLWGNYFGDMEICQSGTTCKYRQSTVKCMEVGVTLVLGKKDIQWLIAEFPHAEVVWASVARRRMIVHQALIDKHTKPMTHRNVAAFTIQEWYRTISRNRKRAEDKSRPSAGRTVSRQSGIRDVGDGVNIRQLRDTVSSLRDDMHNLRAVLRQDAEGLRHEMLSEVRAALAEVRGAADAPNQSLGGTRQSTLHT